MTLSADDVQRLSDLIPKECRHGRGIYDSCAICDQVDPLNCALEEVEHFLRKIENGYPAAREEATELLARITQFRDEAATKCHCGAFVMATGVALISSSTGDHWVSWFSAGACGF